MNRLIFPVTKKAAGKEGIKYSSEMNRNALFPSRLRELRNKLGVSQDKMAQALGVSKSTLGLYETGDTLPDARTLRDIAVYFNVSADWLLGLTDTRSADIEVKQICKKTGLSEGAVASVISLVTPPPGMDDIESCTIGPLNDLLESPTLYSFLWKMDILKNLNQESSRVLDSLGVVVSLERELGEIPPEIGEFLDNKDGHSIFDVGREERYSRLEVIDAFTKIIDELYKPVDLSLHYMHFQGRKKLAKLADFARAHGQHEFADFIEGDWAENNEK